MAHGKHVGPAVLERWADGDGRPQFAAALLPAGHPRPVVRKIVHLRWKKRLGPVQIADRLGLAASTVYAVLVHCRLNRLAHVDRATGEPIRRYEHDTPGSLLYVDVKKLGNIPDDGGWRYVGRAQGKRNRADTPGGGRNPHRYPVLDTAFVHTVLDDHSRAVYARSTTTRPPPPPPACCAGRRPGLPPAASGSNEYSPTTARPTAPTPGATPASSWASDPSGPGPTGRRPTARMNGSTAADGWAFARLFGSESARRKALPGWLAGWLHEYNHHRPHTAIGRPPPITRLNNLSGQYS